MCLHWAPCDTLELVDRLQLTDQSRSEEVEVAANRLPFLDLMRKQCVSHEHILREELLHTVVRELKRILLAQGMLRREKVLLETPDHT